MRKYTEADSITAGSISPNSSRMMGSPCQRQTPITASEISSVETMTCPAVSRAFFSFCAPRNCAATTAPPVANAAKMLMMSVLMLSTSETPLIAASPSEETITVSAMPTVMVSVCSMISGRISFFSAPPVNRGVSSSGRAFPASAARKRFENRILCSGPPLYSLRSASTAFLREAIRAGMWPPSIVSSVLMTISSSACSGWSCATFSSSDTL